MPTDVPALEMRGITKRYPGVLANDHIDLDLQRGEIHALLGENGAGKSTLMNILYGLAVPNEGEILLDGEPVAINGPADAIARGISMVHQHFMLVPVLTVAENILLGEETMANADLHRPRGGPSQDRRARPAVRLRDRPRGQGRDRSPSAGSSVSRSSRPCIARPGSSCSTSRRPSSRPRRPRRSSRSFAGSRPRATRIVFISHKLYEVLEIADRITVIRRGRVVGERIPAETNEDDLAELMVGRDVQLIVDRGVSHPGAPCARRPGSARQRRPRAGGRPRRRPRGSGRRGLRDRRGRRATARTSSWRR